MQRGLDSADFGCLDSSGCVSGGGLSYASWVPLDEYDSVFQKGHKVMAVRWDRLESVLCRLIITVSCVSAAVDV